MTATLYFSKPRISFVCVVAVLRSLAWCVHDDVIVVVVVAEERGLISSFIVVVV
jgi:hypothetical protein